MRRVAVRSAGIGDIELAFKYVLNADAARTRILSAGIEVALPTGSEVRGLGLGTVVFEPYLAAGTMWRDVYLQARRKSNFRPTSQRPIARSSTTSTQAGIRRRLPTTWTIGVEVNGENEEIALTPQLRKGLTKTGALGAALRCARAPERAPRARYASRRVSLVGIP